MSVVKGTSSIWPGAADAFWPASRLRKRMSRGRRMGEAYSVTRGLKRARRICLVVVARLFRLAMVASAANSLRHSRAKQKQDVRRSALLLRRRVSFLQGRRHGGYINCKPVSRVMGSIGRCRSSVRRNAQSLAVAQVASTSACKRERLRHGEND